MAELKEKVLLALHNGKQLEITLDDISKSQENLLKNHSNPVFCNKDKNKILEGYTDLQNLGKSLNRYGVLKFMMKFLSDRIQIVDVPLMLLKIMKKILLKNQMKMMNLNKYIKYFWSTNMRWKRQKMVWINIIMQKLIALLRN